MSFQADIPKFGYRFQATWSFGHASALRENWLAKTLNPPLQTGVLNLLFCWSLKV